MSLLSLFCSLKSPAQPLWMYGHQSWFMCIGIGPHWGLSDLSLLWRRGITTTLPSFAWWRLESEYGAILSSREKWKAYSLLSPSLLSLPLSPHKCQGPKRKYQQIVQFGISLNRSLEAEWGKSTFPDDPSLGFPFDRGYVSFAGGGKDSRATQVREEGEEGGGTGW